MVNPFELNKKITSASSARDILELHERHGRDFNHVNLSVIDKPLYLYPSRYAYLQKVYCSSFGLWRAIKIKNDIWSHQLCHEFDGSDESFLSSFYSMCGKPLYFISISIKVLLFGGKKRNSFIFLPNFNQIQTTRDISLSYHFVNIKIEYLLLCIYFFVAWWSATMLFFSLH